MYTILLVFCGMINAEFFFVTQYCKLPLCESVRGHSHSTFAHLWDKNYGQHANSPFKSPLIGLCTCLCSRDRRPPHRFWPRRPSFKLPLPRLWSLSNGENPGINFACPIKLSPYKWNLATIHIDVQFRYMGHRPDTSQLCTGWPIRFIKTYRWHWFESCV